MDERHYRILKWTAIGLGVLVGAAMLWQTFVIGRAPGDQPFLEGEQHFEDEQYQRALAKYEEALDEDPDHFHALRAKARTLMQLERARDALAMYAAAIARRPDFAPLYANRGILLDRMGRYRDAVEDYERALALDPELAEGPHWLTRFLRNQPEKPPTIADRARYLRTELAKPEDERLLRVPEIDAEQRSYKQ